MASEFKDDWLRKSRLSIDQVGFKRYPQTDLKELRSVTQPRGKSFFFISAKYESLDYDVTEKQIYLEDEKTKPYSYFVKRDILRPLIFMGAGIIIACIGTFVHVAIQRIGEVKYSYLCDFIDDHHSTGAGNLTLTILMWYLGVIVLVMLSSSIVIFIAPYASGGGVAQTIAYLNGISVPNLLSIKGLFVKMFSTVLTCTSGLAGGKEGPMLHMGATVGSRFPDLFTKFKFCSIFKDFQNDHERRDLGAAGFAAGIACAFHAPVGGLLLALEEGVSYWNISLMWKIFLCSITSVFFITVLLSIIEGAPGHFNSPDLLTLGKIEDETTHYEYFEFIYFIIVGVIGGILGAILVFIHMYLTYFRKRFINTNIRKLTESFLVAFLVASLYMISIFSYNKCKTVASKTEAGGHAGIIPFPAPAAAPVPPTPAAFCFNIVQSNI
uniref:Chloride channel protein n=1 Tax=Clastoptera arizonana TaxID=38151 RepID=A0A1B6DBP5_9HEMI